MTTTFTPTPNEAQQFAILGADPEHIGHGCALAVAWSSRHRTPCEFVSDPWAFAPADEIATREAHGRRPISLRRFAAGRVVIADPLLSPALLAELPDQQPVGTLADAVYQTGLSRWPAAAMPPLSDLNEWVSEIANKVFNTNGASLFPLGALVVIERTGKVVDGHARAVERVN